MVYRALGQNPCNHIQRPPDRHEDEDKCQWLFREKNHNHSIERFRFFYEGENRYKGHHMYKQVLFSLSPNYLIDRK